jgi:hypothetical protein
LLLLVCLEGCPFVPETIDEFSGTSTEVKNTIKSTLKRDSTILPKSIICPEKISIKINSVFQCKVESDIGVFVVEGKIKDSEGTYDIKFKNLMGFSLVEKRLKNQILESYNIEVSSVECPDIDRLAKPGDTFLCKVTDLKKETRTVVIKVENEYADWSWKVLP